MCSALDHEHLGADIPDTKIVTPRVLRMSGDIEVRPSPLPPANPSLIGYAEPVRPSRLRRLIDTLRMAW